MTLIHQSLTVATKEKKQVVSLGKKINNLIEESGVEEGQIHLTALHTTCCLTTADLDPGTDQDYLEAIEKIFPKGDWRHPHNPQHVGDHIMSSLIGASLSLPIQNGQLLLGRWQQPVLIELNGPRQRHLHLIIRS